VDALAEHGSRIPGTRTAAAQQNGSNIWDSPTTTPRGVVKMQSCGIPPPFGPAGFGSGGVDGLGTRAPVADKPSTGQADGKHQPSSQK